MEKHQIYNLFALIPILETERLVLRRLRIADWRDMYEYASNDDVTRYLLWDSHHSPEQTKGYLSHLQTLYDNDSFHDWALVRRGDGKMIGTCGFTRIDRENDSAELGYVLNPKMWGEGLAAEALMRVMEYGFDKLRLNRVECRCMEGNVNSIRVMEKCGMRYEGTFRQAMKIKGQHSTIIIYALLLSEYRAMQKGSRGEMPE